MKARSSLYKLVAVALTAIFALPAHADSVGQLKISTGSVFIERAGNRIPAPVGTRIEASDTIETGANGTAGITFIDNSRLSIGPDSRLLISRFNFNPATHDGNFDSTLKRGTLSVISGKLAKRSPDAMTVSTPSTILGVRGTEFVVRVGD